MKKRLIAALIGIVLIVGMCCGGTIIVGNLLPKLTPTPTLIPTNTLEPTKIPTNTLMPTMLPTNNIVPTRTTKLKRALSNECALGFTTVNTLYMIYTGPSSDLFCTFMLAEESVINLGGVRVFSYPTEPIICSKSYENGSYIFVIDTDPTQLAGIILCHGLEAQ